ncbi:MAG: DUF5630 domain-containing protein [Legionella sp.]|nr:DUF5630 domain-containing protein [Legionella sp.]
MKEKPDFSLYYYDGQSSSSLPESVFSLFEQKLKQDNLYDFYEAILIDQRLNHTAKNEALSPLWDQLLKDNPIYIAKNKAKSLRPQLNVKTFDLIMGFYIFFKKIDPNNLDSPQSQSYIRRGIDEYHSFPCLNLKLTHLFRQKNKLEAHTLTTELLNEVHMNLPQYFSARYVLIAYINFKVNAPQACLSSLILAKYLEPLSENELHNAFRGGPLLSRFLNIDEIIHFANSNLSLSAKQKDDAKKDAGLAFKRLTLDILGPPQAETKADEPTTHIRLAQGS